MLLQFNLKTLACFLLVAVFPLTFIAGKPLPVVQATATENDEQTSAQTADQAKPADVRKIVVKVLGPDENPIAGATISVGRFKPTVFTTDQNGSASVEIGEMGIGEVVHQFTVDAENFVPLRATWSPRELKSLTEELVFHVGRGQSIGGRVVDQQGRPVANAELRLHIDSSDERQRVRRFVEWLSATTDQEGNWVFNRAPREITSLSMFVRHSKFITVEQSPALKSLQDRTSRIVLQPGSKVFGTVTDQDGNPIKNAELIAGLFFSYSDFKFNKRLTDEQGRYEFSNLGARDQQLTLLAEGFAPDAISLSLNGEPQEINFKLSKGNRIRIQVVDEQGAPVSQARVAPHVWRGYFILVPFLDKIPILTDADGFFVWEHAPAEAVGYGIRKDEFETIDTEPLEARDDAYKFVFKRFPRVRVTGNVVDSETDEPITTFEVIGLPDYYNADLVQNARGEFDCEVGTRRSLQIRAEGYEVPDPQYPTEADDEQHFEFRLRRIGTIEGHVFDAVKQAVPAARVYLLVLENNLTFINGLPAYSNKPVFARTGMDGAFKLPDTGQPFFRLIVDADEGYAAVTKQEFTAAKRRLTLTPWATLEGTLMTGDAPAARETVALYAIGHCNYGYVTFEAQTDAMGNFSFDKIPADAEWHVARKIIVSESANGTSARYSHGRRIELKAGEITQVTLGGYNGKVTGKLAMPKGDERKITNWKASLAGLMRIGGPDAAEVIHPDDDRHYDFRIKQDGSFDVNDLPPGGYHLVITLFEAKAPGTLIGTAQKKFSIPVDPDKQSIDLGTLELEAAKQAQPKTGEEL